MGKATKKTKKAKKTAEKAAKVAKKAAKQAEKAARNAANISKDLKAREAVIRFGGIFVFYESKDEQGNPKYQVIFPNSRPVSAALHDPYLTFRERDLFKTELVRRTDHDIVAGVDADPLVQVCLYGEDQKWSGLPRGVGVFPDGAAFSAPPQVDPSVRSLFDLRKSGVQTVRSEGSYVSALLPIEGGTVKGDRQVPGTWRIGEKGEQFVILDAIEWRVPYERFLEIRLVDLPRPGGVEREKSIRLSSAEGPLRLAFSSFADWHDDIHDPSYNILEQVIPAPGKSVRLPADPEAGLGYPWPILQGKRTPGSHCPNAYFNENDGP